MIDTIFCWKGWGNGFGNWLSKCRLRIIEHGDKTIVIATELPDNHGTSITNCAEYLATLVVRQYELFPDRLIWIEHYLERSFGKYDRLAESYDLVELDWDGERFATPPRWKRITPETVEQLIGQPLSSPIGGISHDESEE
jgi:hypothetical protein